METQREKMLVNEYVCEWVYVGLCRTKH